MAEINSDALHQASSMDEEAIEVMKQHDLSSAENSDVTADPSAAAADESTCQQKNVTYMYRCEVLTEAIYPRYVCRSCYL